MTKASARYLLAPEAIAAGWAIMRITAGYEGDVLIMSREHPLPAPGSGPAGPSRYRADRWSQGQITSLMLAESSDLLLHVQMLPANRWLIVKSRTRSEQDANARVYGPWGDLEWSFHAGDGIEDVQSTPDGQIWISYFDEGVFGRLPLSRSGLVCADDRGEVLFRYPCIAKPRGLLPIYACY